jgi:beta-1,4-N-acetylglucosaminyltransferase
MASITISIWIKSGIPRCGHMIFVTVGTHDQQFDRLVRTMDELAWEIKEAVIIQRGYSRYTPTKAAFFTWATMNEMEQQIRQSRIVVAQAGAGTIITVFRANKPLVLVPRLRRYGEHYNDHQVELASALHQLGRARMVHPLSTESLRNAVYSVPPAKKRLDPPIRLISAIRTQLENWQSGNTFPPEQSSCG